MLQQFPGSCWLSWALSDGGLENGLQHASGASGLC